MQSDAEPPYVGLGAQADGGADGWQVVGNLETGELDFTHLQIYFKQAHYLAVSAGGVFKVKNRRYEDTCDQTKEGQRESPQDAGGERHPDEQGSLMA